MEPFWATSTPATPPRRSEERSKPQLKGADIFVIANADTVMTRPTSELLAELFPNVPLKKQLGPNETLLSIEKARRVLGYEPQHSWRDPASRSR